jgi:ankyrin repeat protein
VAAFKGHVDVVKLLIDAKADVNTKNNSGYTVLFAAAHYGHSDVVNMLKAAGAKE